MNTHKHLLNEAKERGNDVCFVLEIFGLEDNFEFEINWPKRQVFSVNLMHDSRYSGDSSTTTFIVAALCCELGNIQKMISRKQSFAPC